MPNKKIRTRMGDGSLLVLSEAELKQDLEEGTEDAADIGKIDPLTQDELDHLFDIYSSSSPPGHVEPGNEVVFTYDTTCNEIQRNLLPIDRTQMLQLYEKVLGADSVELGHIDYSFKAIKPIVGYERSILEQALLVTTVPVLYGAMPNLGIYSQPDGPAPNSSELMSAGKIDEARAASEAAIEHAVADMVFVANKLGVSLRDLTDPVIMAEIREDLQLGLINPQPGLAMGMEAKFRISELLGIEINSLDRFKGKAGLF